MKKHEDKSRGFSELLGETISSIDASSINSVTITFESGKEIEIDGDERTFYGIAVLRATVTQEADSEFDSE